MKVGKVDTILRYINTLYCAKQTFAALKETERYTLEQMVEYRYMYSVPVLNGLKVYCDDSKLRISNILAE